MCGFHWEGLANPACVKMDVIIKKEGAAGEYEVVDILLGVVKGAYAHYEEHWEVLHKWWVYVFVEMDGVAG